MDSDPDRHIQALERFLAERHGDGWEIDSIEREAGIANASRHVSVTEVTGAGGPDRIEVRLPRGTKPSDGDRLAIKLSLQHGEGFHLTRFDPYAGQAVLTRMDAASLRCRAAVAVALGVKPWEVQVRSHPDGGFDLDLPARYAPSRHDAKLTEIAQVVVGQPGWYVDTDPSTNPPTASIVPGELPSFPPTIPTR